MTTTPNEKFRGVLPSQSTRRRVSDRVPWSVGATAHTTTAPSKQPTFSARDDARARSSPTSPAERLRAKRPPLPLTTCTHALATIVARPPTPLPRGAHRIRAPTWRLVALPVGEAVSPPPPSPTPSTCQSEAKPNNEPAAPSRCHLHPRLEPPWRRCTTARTNARVVVCVVWGKGWRCSV